jgi:hypothetical protein
MKSKRSIILYSMIVSLLLSGTFAFAFAEEEVRVSPEAVFGCQATGCKYPYLNCVSHSYQAKD